METDPSPPDTEDKLATPEEIRAFTGFEEKEAEVREWLGFPPKKEDVIPILEAAQVHDLEGGLRAFGEYVSFAQPWHPRLCLLWAAHVLLQPILPGLAIHLAFTGPKSSGKSEATKLMAELTGRRYVVGGTLASFIRDFNDEEFPLIGIDELDSNLRRLPDLEAMMRAASDPDAIYRTSVPGKGRKWRSEDVKVGGPKVFNYRSGVEDAVLSRTLVMELPRQNDSGLILRNLLGGNPPRQAIKDWLAKRAAQRLKEWTREEVEARMREPAFRERLDALPTVLPRQKQIGACLLIVSDIMGWDLEEPISEALRAKQDEEESYEDVKEVLIQLYDGEVAQRGERAVIGLTAAFSAINAQRKADGLYGISYQTFARVRREFGFQDGVSVKKIHAKGGKRFLIFDKAVREALGLKPRDEEVEP